MNSATRTPPYPMFNSSLDLHRTNNHTSDWNMGKEKEGQQSWLCRPTNPSTYSYLLFLYILMVKGVHQKLQLTTSNDAYACVKINFVFTLIFYFTDRHCFKGDLIARMTIKEFFGCTFIAYGLPFALFFFTIARDPLRTIVLIAR